MRRRAISVQSPFFRSETASSGKRVRRGAHFEDGVHLYYIARMGNSPEEPGERLRARAAYLHEEQPGFFFGASEHTVIVNETVRGFRDLKRVLREHANSSASHACAMFALADKLADEFRISVFEGFPVHVLRVHGVTRFAHDAVEAHVRSAHKDRSLQSSSRNPSRTSRPSDGGS